MTRATPTGSERLLVLDVTRAVGLVGVIFMNYHGYLINLGGPDGSDTVLGRFLNPWRGPLGTRFAATFVMVAGMGVSLLTRSAVRSADRAMIVEARWRLIRRGCFLYAFGYFLNWIWPGTILFFYGAFFLVAAVIFTWPTPWVLAFGICSALSSHLLQWWVLSDTGKAHNLSWLVDGSGDAQSPRELFLNTTIRGTHPLLPWLLFFAVGLVIGRLLPLSPARVRRLTLWGVGLIVVGYLLVNTLPNSERLLSPDPFDRAILYSVTALGAALVAFGVASWAVARFPDGPIVRSFALAGRTSLTIYVTHIVVFNLLVNRLELIRPTGLDVATVFALSTWVVSLSFAAWWQRRYGLGPLEKIYRDFSA